ncbi:MAG TPA: hypothetical protein VJ750_01700 [Rhizomicrobium sp.]|nr:hypothetical protein [Rhizomicrobium sp.]
MRFETLREDLLKGGIAPRHVRRYLAELSEHLDDLTAQQREAGYDAEDAAIRARAKLGSDTELAGAMLEQKQFRSLASRAPWAVFGLLPPVVGIVAAFALIAPLALIARMARMIAPGGINAALWFQQLASAVTMAGNLALPPLLAAAFVMLAARQRMAKTWPLLAAVLLALLDLQFRAQFPPPGHRGGTLSIGAALWLFHPDSLLHAWPLAPVQTALTLLPLLWLIRARLRQKALS